MGGALTAIERGFQQREIADAAYRVQRAIEEGQKKVVGVNVHRDEEEVPEEILTIDPASEERQVERLTAFKAARDGRRTVAVLDALEGAARGESNLMPPILDAVRAAATLGEISDRLRRVFGEHREGDLG